MQQAIDRHFRTRHGIISRRTALELGMSPAQIKTRLSSGQWTTQARGIYQLGGTTVTSTSRLLVACLQYGAHASHRSAAFLHGIGQVRASRPEIVVVRGRTRRAPGVWIHETTQPELLNPTTIKSVPCTGLTRTVVDLGAVLSTSQMHHVVDSVLRDRQTSLQALADAVQRHAKRGRDGVGRLHSALNALTRSDGRSVAVPLSGWSRMAADLLADHGLPRPEFEYDVWDSNGRLVGYIDLAYPSSKVAIELDSVRWHLNRDAFVHDRRRNNRLVLEGWTVIQFTWNDFDDPRHVCETVERVLAGQ